MRDDFAVFILTHGRARQQKTLATLKKCGYTGKLFLVIDDEDEQANDYLKLYGDRVIVFSKKKVEKTFDTMTNRKEYCACVYARIFILNIAQGLGVKWAFQFDDDVTNLLFRILDKNKLKAFKVRHIDDLFETMCEVMNSGKLAVLGFSQAESFTGGANNIYLKGHQRKISHAMMFNAENPITFRGLFYEDLLAALDTGIDGRVAISTMLVSNYSPKLASNAGGMNNLYKSNGSYVAGFYSVMAYPSVIRLVEEKGEFKLRIKGSAFCPMIIGERWRK